MDKNYELLGLQPGCSKKQLKKAYLTAIQELEDDNLVGEQKLSEAYRMIKAELKHGNIKKKPRGFWKTSKKTRAYYTGPHGSAAARSALRRFGLRDLLCAISIVLLSWLLYFFCEAVTLNIFPSSQYPLLAKTFSGRLVAAVVRLIAYIAAYIFYFYYFLLRKVNGMRRLRHGFVFGFFILLICLFVPQNQLFNTGMLLSDVSAMKENHFSVVRNIILEDSPVQTNNTFGDLYTYKIKSSSESVYIPKQLLEDPNGKVHQASVAFLPHSHAAAKVDVRATEHKLISCIGDCFYIDLKGNTDIKSLYLQRSSKTLVIEPKTESSEKSNIIHVNLGTIPLKNASGKQTVNTISSDNIAAALLPNGKLLLAFSAEDSTGQYKCVAAVIQQKTGQIVSSWQLNGEFVYKLYSCSGRYYIFTQSLVENSFTERMYALQLYDPAANRIVYTADKQYTLPYSPHIANFAEDGVWISKHSNGASPIGKFSVPQMYMK